MLRVEAMTSFCGQFGPFSVILASKEFWGTEVDQPLFHVLLEGRKVGPYDRRTIVGMRIKKTLTSDHVLIGVDGTQLTVADLIGRPGPKPFNAERSGSFSIVHATFPASLLEVEGKGVDIPAFKGEVEARVQADVLRLAGRFRQGLGWKEDRIKLTLKDVVHARVKGSQVELWLRSAGKARLQRVCLELFTPEAAGDLVEWFTSATPYPESGGAPAAAAQAERRGMWAAGACIAAVAVVLVVLVLVAVLHRRF
jgi:hypothetical protein